MLHTLVDTALTWGKNLLEYVSKRQQKELTIAEVETVLQPEGWGQWHCPVPFLSFLTEAFALSHHLFPPPTTQRQPEKNVGNETGWQNGSV